MSNKFTLKQCSLFPADSDSRTLSGEFGLLKGNPQISYCESITSPSVSVEVTVLDTDGILSAKGVYGGEGLSIKADAEEDVDLDDFIISKDKHELILNDVKDIVSGVKQQSITLQFVSKDFMKNETARLNRRFTGNIGNHVKDILTKDIKGIQTKKSVSNINQTTNNYTFVGNQEKAFDIIQRLQPKSQASKDDFGFLFFENYDGYHFKSIESLMKQEPVAEYDKTEVSTLNDFVIDDYVFANGGDLTMNLKAGTYSNETIYIDLDKHKEEVVKFNLDEVSNITRPPKIPRDISNKSSRRMLRLRDVGAMQKSETSALEDVQKVNELSIYQNKSYARNNLLFSQALIIKVSLNPSLRVGQTISVRFPLVDPDDPNEQSLDLGNERTNDISGKYLIAKLMHDLGNGKFSTHLTLIRDVFTPTA